MEAPKSDAPKLPDMVMCGDHPSFTKTELNVKTDVKMDEKDKEKAKDKSLSYAKITPTPSRTERSDRADWAERTERTERSERAERTERSAERRARAPSSSEHALQLSAAAAAAARRRVRSLEVVQRPDVDVAATGNRALVQAALGSFRWPPYLLCVWVLVLVLTHVLHCLVSLLERALPALRKCSEFFRTWTEESWRRESDVNQRVYPAALACVTAVLYALYFTLYALYAVVLWSIEPLCSDVDEKRSAGQLDIEANVTNYEDDIKTNSCIKP